MNSALLAAIATLSLMLWREGAMSTGEAAAGLALVMRILAMSGWVMRSVRGVFENVGVVQESMRTIAQPHKVTDMAAARPLGVRDGAIRFEDVSFHYGAEAEVLERFDLAIAPGEKVGLVGPSGAGKSTIASLLLRLHDLEGGRITIDGQDIARRHPGQPARADRRGDAGYLAIAPLDPRQHPLRAPRGHAGGGRARGKARPCA